MAVIPTGNPAALIGYYLGIASIIPFLGCLASVPAIICGIVGLIKSSKEPAAGGKGHAITAIVLGLIGPFIGWGIIMGFSMLLGG